MIQAPIAANQRSALPLAGCLILALSGFTARADDPCAAFTWDVVHERAIFATQPLALVAATDAKTAPIFEIDRAYRISLDAQTTIQFASPLGNAGAPEGAFAGLVRISAANARRYRVALDRGFWLDVVEDGNALRSIDYQGGAGCDALHKIVEFALPAGKSLLLRFSGSAAPAVTVTR